MEQKLADFQADFCLKLILVRHLRTVSDGFENEKKGLRGCGCNGHWQKKPLMLLMSVFSVTVTPKDQSQKTADEFNKMKIELRDFAGKL